jgi:hypothetical protein
MLSDMTHVFLMYDMFPDREDIRSLVTTLPHPTRDSSIEWKMTRLYESCMALDTIESDKYTPLRKIINQMGIANDVFILIKLVRSTIIVHVILLWKISVQKFINTDSQITT